MDQSRQTSSVLAHRSLLQTLISLLFNRALGVPETYLVDQQSILRLIQIRPIHVVGQIQPLSDSLLAGN